MAARIRNVGGTSNRRNCRCGYWIDHYYTHGGEGTVCVVCRRKPVVGGHVWVEESALLGLFQWQASGEHIVPLCAACNMQPGWIRVAVAFTRVSANTQQMGCAIRRHG